MQTQPDTDPKEKVLPFQKVIPLHLNQILFLKQTTPRCKHHQNGYSQWPQWNTYPSRFPAEYIQESSHDWHFMYYLKMAFTDSNYQQHNLKQQCDQCYPHCKVIISI